MPGHGGLGRGQALCPGWGGDAGAGARHALLQRGRESAFRCATAGQHGLGVGVRLQRLPPFMRNDVRECQGRTFLVWRVRWRGQRGLTSRIRCVGCVGARGWARAPTLDRACPACAGAVHEPAPSVDDTAAPGVDDRVTPASSLWHTRRREDDDDDRRGCPAKVDRAGGGPDGLAGAPHGRLAHVLQVGPSRDGGLYGRVPLWDRPFRVRRPIRPRPTCDEAICGLPGRPP